MSRFTPVTLLDMKTNRSETFWIETRDARRRFVITSGLFFLFLTIIFGWPLLFGGHTLSGNDIVNSYLPYKTEMKRQMLQGEFPHWNDLSFCGRPLQADMQTGLFYPPNLLFWIMPPNWAFDLTTLFHFWIGGWGMALWMRRRVARTAGAFLSGALFMFGGYATTRLMPGIVVFISALAWMPWLFLCWDRLLESFRGYHGRKRSGAAAVFALISALEILAGAPQITFYIFIALGIYALILAWRTRGEETSEEGSSPESWVETIGGWFNSLLPFRISQMAIMAGIVVLAAGICAVQLMPASMMIGQSWDRATGASWDYVVDGSLDPRMLLTLVVPGFFGDPFDEVRYWGSSVGYSESNAYAGVIPLFFLILFLIGRWWTMRRTWFDGLIGARKRDAVRFEVFLLVLLVIAFLFSFGKYSPFFWLAYHFIPGFDRFRVPGRMLLFYVFASAALSGWALDRVLGLGREQGISGLTNRRAPLRMIALTAIIGAVLCVLLLWGAIPLMHRLQMPFYPFEGRIGDPRAPFVPYLEGVARNGAWFLLAQWVVVSLLVLGATLVRGRARSVTVWLLILIGTGELLHHGWNLQATEPRAKFMTNEYPQTERVEFLEKELKSGGRFLWFDSLMSYEFDQFQPELLNNRPMMHGLAELRGYDPVNSRRYGLFMNLVTHQPLTRNPRAFMFVPDIPPGPIDLGLLGLLNCRLALSYTQLNGLEKNEAGHWNFQEKGAGPETLRAYRLKNTTVPAWFVSDPLILPQGTPLEEIAIILSNPRFDVGKRAIVEGDPFAALSETVKGEAGEGQRNGEGVVTLLKQKPGFYSLRVMAAKQSVLVASCSYYPGWRARIDGHTVPVLPVNLALCGVGVPAGEHTVELFYRPWQFEQGGAISLASLLLVVLLFVRRRAES